MTQSKEIIDRDAYEVFQPGAGSKWTHLIFDCTGELIGFLYIDCGVQTNETNGYCVQPFGSPLSSAIFNDTLAEAEQKLNAFQCTIKRFGEA